MERLALLRPLSSTFPSHLHLLQPRRTLHRNSNFLLSCSPVRSQPMGASETASKADYKPAIFDEWLLAIFRKKMVEEVGWDSDKPGYDGLMEVVNRLMMKGGSDSETTKAAVRILRSLFPSWLLVLFKQLISPLDNGRIAAMMVARVTAISCQWLMGPLRVNSVELPNGSSWSSGVFVERCKYLEETKCVGVCVNTCKMPTQTFIRDHMGVPLVMEPNFSDYSCQYNFGVHPPPIEEDKALQEPCLEICPNATRRRKLRRNLDTMQCPKV